MVKDNFIKRFWQFDNLWMLWFRLWSNLAVHLAGYLEHEFSSFSNMMRANNVCEDYWMYLLQSMSEHGCIYIAELTIVNCNNQ